MFDHQPAAQPESEQEKPCHWGQDRRVLLGLTCSSFISILLGLVVYYRSRSNTACPSVMPWQAPPPCLSSACQKAAARLSTAADPFAQPCDYFLASCGAEGLAATSRRRQRGQQLARGERGLVERAPGEPGRVVHLDRVTDALPYSVADKQSLLQALREILESPDRPSSMNSAEQKVRMFYRSCMNTSAIERVGSEPVLKLIRKLGGWAVSGQWNRTSFSSTLSRLMREYSTFPFFSVYVGKHRNDSDCSDRKYIQIDQPEFHIPVEWDSKKNKSKVTHPTLLQLLHLHLQLLGLLGVPSSSTNRHTGMFMQLLSELALATSPLPHRLQRQLLHQRLTLRELQAAAPAIDWLGCLRATFHPLPVNQSDVVILHNLPYIMSMSKTISKWRSMESDRYNDERSNLSPNYTFRCREVASTQYPASVYNMFNGPLHTFMILSLLHKVTPALSSKFIEIQTIMSVQLGDTLEAIPHWKKCVLEAEKGFDTVFFSLMKERVGEKEAEEVIQDVYSSLKSTLSMLKWRDEELHSSVLNRVSSLTPRLPINNAKIDQQYSEVVVSEDDYFSNYLQSLALQQKRRNRLFSQTTALDILSNHPSLSSEEINIPLGLFVPPFFHPSYPRAVNYGRLGTLMAQKILLLLLPDIQSQSEAPQRVSDCVWAHYLRLTESLHGTDPPPLTPAQQREIWLQHTALHIALQAYNQSLLKCRGDSSLSSLSYTHLFLTSFAQNDCNSHPSNEHLPFEPYFLVTVICMNSDLCPKRMNCSHNFHQGISQNC
ncbi:kell blood group glycoprotein isoform X1 [Conger conger]|uniref:kell blood group glycoprotein isoform X1 n=1 Tax=Conger conger TaxID=82655 RepID=UPI002A5A3CA5|nr:kell blood group glycoprotein isoform X1 [Conger conger]